MTGPRLSRHCKGSHWTAIQSKSQLKVNIPDWIYIVKYPTHQLTPPVLSFRATYLFCFTLVLLYMALQWLHHSWYLAPDFQWKKQQLPCRMNSSSPAPRDLGFRLLLGLSDASLDHWFTSNRSTCRLAAWGHLEQSLRAMAHTITATLMAHYHLLTQGLQRRTINIGLIGDAAQIL